MAEPGGMEEPAGEDELMEQEEAFLGDEEGEVLADLEGEEAEEGSEDGDGGEGEEEEEPRELPHDPSLQRLPAHSEPVYATAAFLGPQSRLFASGGGDDRAVLWTATPGEEVRAQELAGHADSVAAVAFSGDGTLLATGGMDGKVCLWDAARPGAGLLRTLEGPGGGLEWLCWHPRGRVVLAGSEDFTAWMWNADDGTCMQVFAGHSGSVSCGSFTPDGRSVVTGSLDCSMRVWSPRGGECTSVTSGHGFHVAALTSLECHPSDAIVGTASEDGTAKFVNLQTGKVTGSLEGHNGSVECLRFCDVLPFVATGGIDGSLILWDVQTATERLRCDHDSATISKVAWAPGTGQLFSGASDGVVRLWDGRSGACVRSWVAHSDAVQDLWVSQDGRTVFSGSEDGSVCIISV